MTGQEQAQPTLWRGLAAAVGALVLLWGPVVLCELVRPLPWTTIVSSPVLSGVLATSAQLTLAVILVLGLGTVLGLRFAGGPARAFQIAAVASVLVVWLHRPLQFLVYRISLPVTSALLILILAAPVAAALLARTRLFQPRFRPIVSAATAALWVLALWGGLELSVFDRRTVMVVLGAAAWLTVELAPGRRAGLLIAGLAGAAVIPLAFTAVGRPEPRSLPRPIEAPNVVVVMIDTLRYDHTALAGYAKKTTPRLARLAEEPRVTEFPRTWAGATSTMPSIKAFFTSQWASHWGFEGASKTGPPAGSPHLASSLRRAGFVTAGFSANGLLVDPGFQEGFDTFWVGGGWQYFRESFVSYRLLLGELPWDGLRFVDRRKLHKVNGETIVKLASRWLDEYQGDRPFFLYVHVVDPHWPFYDLGQGLIDEDLRGIDTPYSHTELLLLEKSAPPNRAYSEDPRRREMLGRYDEGVLWADRMLARFLDKLDGLGLADDTLLVVTADHGEEFFEHNSFSHGFDVYEEHSRVPLIVRWPRRPAFEGMPRKVEEPVSLLDFYPTLMDLLEIPTESDFAGRSLLPILRGEDGDGRPLIVESFPGAVCRTAYVEGRYKVRMDFDRQVPPEETPFVVVFDLETDPGEVRPIPSWDPTVREIIERARHTHQERWLAWPDRLSGGESVPGAPESPIEQLRSLGYVQ